MSVRSEERKGLINHNENMRKRTELKPIFSHNF